MKLSPSTKWTCCVFGALLLGALTGPAFSQVQPPDPNAKPLVDRANLRMQPEAENPNGNTPVFGSNVKEGFYVYRNHFGPGQTSRPHFHDKDRWVTVISGTWYTGEGDVFDPKTMVPIKQGGFMFHPANWHHYDGSMDGKPVVVQIMGYGPIVTTQTEVDAKGNPIGANPKAPKAPTK